MNTTRILSKPVSAMVLALLWFLAPGTVLAAAPAMQVYALDGLQRVRPHDPPGRANSVSIAAAQNEYEPFQIAIHAGHAGLRGVEVSVTNLRAARPQVISSNHVALYREHFLEVTHPSPKTREGAGWYPDALIPFQNPIDGKPITSARFVASPFDVDPDSNQVIWADVYVPKGTPAGQYSGEVRVKAKGEKTILVPIKLTVWGFQLPDTPSMRSNFGGLESRVARLHRMNPESEEFRAVERRYAQALAAHRICPPIPGYLMPAIASDGGINPGATHAALKEWVDAFHVTGFPLRLIGRDPLGKDRERATRYLQSMYAYLKTNAWEKFAYVYVVDEPNDAAAYEQVRQRAKLIHEAQPGIKVLCTEQPTPQERAWGTLVGSVDIWVPLWTLFEEPATAERLAAGDELWSYTALCQGGKRTTTPYWQIDFPLLDYRIPTWISWRLGVTGLLYWTTVYWEKTDDVWTNPATYGEGAARFNGEGSLFYPGTDAGFAGPVASIRLKQIRESLEDYEYLNLLAQRGDKAFADQCARRLAKSWTAWDENPADLRAAREEIGRRLSANALSPK